MKFLIDHDVPDEGAQVLRHWGHEVHKLREVLPVTATDERVFAVAQEAGWVILSCNRGHFLGLASATAGRGGGIFGPDHSRPTPQAAGGVRPFVVIAAPGRRDGAERLASAGLGPQQLPEFRPRGDASGVN